MNYNDAPQRSSVGWHLSIQVDASGLAFPLTLRLVASVARTEVMSKNDIPPHVPPAIAPPVAVRAHVAPIGGVSADSSPGLVPSSN